MRLDVERVAISQVVPCIAAIWALAAKEGSKCDGAHCRARLVDHRRVEGMASRITAPKAPVISAPDLPDQLSDAEPSARADLTAARIALQDATDLAHSTIEQGVIEGQATRLDLRGATVYDVEFSGIRIADLQSRALNGRRILIAGGRIGTLDLTDARLTEVEIRDVRIDYLTLAGARVDHMRVSGCTITTLDMPQAVLSRVTFENTGADEVDPRGMRATDLDLRGLDALSYLDVTALKGATLDSRQVQLLAPALAAAAGIRVID